MGDPARSARFVGLISGTSADGIDAVLLRVGEAGPDALPDTWVEAFRTTAFPGPDRARILAAAAGEATTPEIAELRRDLGEWFGTAAREVLADAGVPAEQVEAVGCHGQTVWHRPPREGGPGTSLQLVDPAVLAAGVGVPVVHDFRSADLAAGGEGAPLVPWPDRVLFSRRHESVALQNLGGMGNVTWLPPREDGRPPFAFDTGPANALMDVCAELASGGARRYDADGALAVAGTVDRALLADLLADPFFRREPPRSTGREHFGPALVRRLADERGLTPGRETEWADLMATFAALTVESVVRALERWVLPRGTDRVILTGGGAENPVLVEGIRAGLAPVPVAVGATTLGMDPGAREAAAFALLAWAFTRGRCGNVPECTGASRPAVLGSWTPAPGRTGPWTATG